MMPPVPSEHATASERALFEEIRRSPELSDWVCLHSVGIARHQRKPFAEADFVVAGPLGVFCIEVKGGDVNRSEGVWTIGWPDRSYTSREGPFKQALSAMHALVDEFVRRTSLALKRRVLFGWGVAFPDIVFREQDPEWDLECVYDRRDTEHAFVHYLDRLAKLSRAREAAAQRSYPDRVGATELASVVQAFRHDFDVVYGLSDLLIDSRRELVRLSDQQYRVLDYALDPGNPRTLCPGAAGSGKTLIALEAVRRLSARGSRVLALCYNRCLADHLGRQLDTVPAGVTVTSLHRFMRSVIRRAGMLDELNAAAESEASDVLYREHFPRLFEEAVLQLATEDRIEPFDCLVIDEGQDILFSPVIDALGYVLLGGLHGGRWLVMLDPELQSELYGRLDPRVLDTLRSYRPAFLPLRENYRNPRDVVEEMCSLTGLEPPVCKRELHSPVEYLTFRTPAQEGKRLHGLLVRLLREGVPPHSITLLSGCARERSCVVRHPPQIGRSIVFVESPQVPELVPDAVTACTVSSYKGLENDVIVLTDLGKHPDREDWERAVTYVGMTRARSKLYAIVEEDFPRSKGGRGT